MTSSNESNNIWNTIVPILVILFIVFIAVLSYLLWSHTDNPAAVGLTEINQSIIPKGTIYHLSEKDFEEFPTLARVIRDNSQKPDSNYTGRNYYSVKLSQEERTQFISKYPGGLMNQTTGESETYFEYKGKYYSFLPPPIS